MFRYIKLKNYKSLVDFEVDLTNKRGAPKKFILIYGENGIGKSNFASVFATLLETFMSKSAIETINRYLESGTDVQSPKFRKMLNDLKDTERIIKSTKTIGSTDNMLLEFGFRVNKKDGFYRLEFDNEKIVSEEFEYNLSETNKISYKIKEDMKSFNLQDNLFKDKTYKIEIENLLNKYWGKHSLISLIAFEQLDKRQGYITSKISKGLYDAITNMITMSVRISGYRGSELDFMGASNLLYSQIFEGSIPAYIAKQLKKVEKLLNVFFTNSYSDIKQVYYLLQEKGDVIYYRLMFKKIVYGKLIDIKYELESAGTKCLVELLPYFMSSLEGRISIIDEIDSNIHDVLINTILEELYDSIEEQIIITTHNTMLLESEKLRSGAYIFNIDKKGKKELVPITDFEDRMHPNINVRKRYLSGLYGGVPFSTYINFDELKDIVEQK